MQKFIALFRSLRPVNGLITALGALLGNLLVPALSSSEVSFLALGLFLIVGYGNLDNDLHDLDSDRINRPDRALPSGRMSPRFAQISAMIVLAAGLSSMALASTMCLIQGLLATPLLWLYNRYFKRLPIIGNLTVAWLCAWSIFTPHFPDIPRMVLPAVIFAFGLTLVRELIKDTEDIEGDKLAGMKSTAVALGSDLTLFGARLIWAGMIVLLPVPWQFHIYSPLYALLVVLLSAPALIWGWRLKGDNPAQLRKMSTALKIGMLGGLIAIALGAK